MNFFLKKKFASSSSLQLSLLYTSDVFVTLCFTRPTPCLEHKDFKENIQVRNDLPFQIES